MEKIAVVTGGASGLGESIAQVLSLNGYKVIVWDRSGTSPHTLINCDVTNPDSVQSALSASLKISPKFDVLVNSAGIAIAIPTISRNSIHDLSAFESVLQVNIIGLFDVCRNVAKHMQGGVIINIASMAAFEGQRGQVAYAASKGAVAGLTMPLARDLASKKIRVVCLCPGIIETPMSSLIKPSIKEKILKAISVGRFGKTQELAHVVQMCVENGYINGTCVQFNGGGVFPNI